MTGRSGLTTASATRMGPAVVGGAGALGYAVMALYWAGIINFGVSIGVPIGKDFINIFTAAHLIQAADIAGIFDPAQFNQVQNGLLGRDLPLYHYLWSYPPVALFLVLPFIGMPYLAGYAAWSAATFLLYAAAACRGGSRLRLIALALAPATIMNLFAGQNGFLTAALLAGGLRLLDRRPVAAGLLFGLLVFKPQLALLVPVVLVAGRRWRALAAGGVTALLAMAASLVVFGLDSWRAYIEQVMPVQRQLMENGAGFFLWCTVTPFFGLRILGLAAGPSYAVQAAVAAVTVIATYCIVRRGAAGEGRDALVLAGTALVSPYLLTYDMTILSLACLAAVSAIAGQEPDARRWTLPAEKVVIALCWLLPILGILCNRAALPVAPLAIGTLFVLVARRCRVPPGDGGAAGAGDSGEGRGGQTQRRFCSNCSAESWNPTRTR